MMAEPASSHCVAWFSAAPVRLNAQAATETSSTATSAWSMAETIANIAPFRMVSRLAST